MLIRNGDLKHSSDQQQQELEVGEKKLCGA